MSRRKSTFTRNAFRPVLQSPSCSCGSCKEQGEEINSEPVAVEEMLPEERHVYETLVASYGDNTTVSELLLDHFVDVAIKYAGEIIDENKYWTRVLPKEEWLESLEPLVREGLKGYFSDLDEQLTKTAEKLENPYTDARLRTIAATETTMARTCSSLLLSDLNNTIVAVSQGKM